MNQLMCNHRQQWTILHGTFSHKNSNDPGTCKKQIHHIIQIFIIPFFILPQLFPCLFCVYSTKSIKQQPEPFPIEIPPTQHKEEMFKCFLVFTKRLGCNLLHDEVPSGHKRDLKSFLKGSLMNGSIRRQKKLKYFTCTTKLMVKKSEISLSMTLEIPDTLHANSWWIHRCHHQENLCINNYQKFLHSKLIEHVRTTAWKKQL